MKRLVILFLFSFFLFSSVVGAQPFDQADRNVAQFAKNTAENIAITEGAVTLTVPEFSHIGIAAAVAVGIAGVYAARKRQKE